MEAALYNQLQSVRLLLADHAGVNAVSLPPNKISNNGNGQPVAPWGQCWTYYDITHGSRTALMYAAANSSLPLIKALLAAGANPHAKDSKGDTALDYLTGRGPVPKNPVLTPAEFTEAKKLLGQ